MEDKAHQAVDRRQCFKIAHEGNNVVGSRACDLGMRATIAKFVGNLVIAHGIGRAALAEIGPAGNFAAVRKFDVDDRRHLVDSPPPRPPRR